MKDGMIVLDASRRIVDMNRAAQQMIGLSGEQAPIGKSVVEVLAKWPHLIERYRDVLDAKDEINFGEGETQRWYELNLVAVVGRKQIADRPGDHPSKHHRPQTGAAAVTGKRSAFPPARGKRQ